MAAQLAMFAAFQDNQDYITGLAAKIRSCAAYRSTWVALSLGQETSYSQAKWNAIFAALFDKANNEKMVITSANQLARDLAKHTDVIEKCSEPERNEFFSIAVEFIDTVQKRRREQDRIKYADDTVVIEDSSDEAYSDTEGMHIVEVAFIYSGVYSCMHYSRMYYSWI
jgi:hypothetical protein